MSFNQYSGRYCNKAVGTTNETTGINKQGGEITSYLGHFDISDVCAFLVNKDKVDIKVR